MFLKDVPFFTCLNDKCQKVGAKYIFKVLHNLAEVALRKVKYLQELENNSKCEDGEQSQGASK